MPVTISGDGGITGLELSDFGDVTGTPTDNQALTWDAATSQWVPETILDTVNAGIGTNVVQAFKADFFSTASTNFIDVTGLSLSITPTLATSKILLIASVNVATNTNNGVIRLFNGTATIGSGTAGSTLNGFGQVGTVASNGEAQSMNLVFLDSPATTSAITYSVQVREDSAGGVFYVNRRNFDAAYGVSSSLTAIEVAA